MEIKPQKYTAEFIIKDIVNYLDNNNIFILSKNYYNKVFNLDNNLIICHRYKLKMLLLEAFEMNVKNKIILF